MNYIKNNPFVAIIALLVVTFLVYYQSLDFKFLSNFDDDKLILQSIENYQLNFESISEIFSSYVYGLYHPLTSLSWALELNIWGANPFYFHLNNVLLHLLVCCLVYFLLKKFTNSTAAIVTTTVFALHPMVVENVSWLSSRKDLIYSIFYLLSLIQYCNFLKKKKWYQFAMVVFFFVLALLGKASAITLPFILLLIDWFYNSKLTVKNIVFKIPLIILSILFAYVNYEAQKEAGILTSLDGYSIIDRFFMLCYSIVYYPFQLLAPFSIHPKNLYPAAEGGLPILYYLSIFPICGLVFWFWKKEEHRKKILFAFLFYLICIGPTLKLIPTGNDLVSNRYFYLPLLMISCFLISFLLKNKKSIVKWSLAIWLVLITVKTYSYQSVYKNSISVWTAVIEDNKDNSFGAAMALNERGNIYLKQGNIIKAKKDINAALKSESTYFRALLNRATIHEKEGNLKAALSDLNTADRQQHDNPEVYRIRGALYGKLNMLDSAINDFNKALIIVPERADLLNNRAIAYSIVGKSEKALHDFSKALELNPYYLDVYVNRAKLFSKNQKWLEAEKDLKKVVELSPNKFEPTILLALNKFKMGKKQEAKKLLSPLANEQHQAANIAQSLFAENLFAESIPYFTIGIGASDIRDKTLYQRAMAYKSLGEYQNAIDDLFAIIENVPEGIFFLEIANMYLVLDEKNKACKFWLEAEKRNVDEAKTNLETYCNSNEKHI